MATRLWVRRFQPKAGSQELEAESVCQLPVGRQQVSNESLILAQNQRWRRA